MPPGPPPYRRPEPPPPRAPRPGPPPGPPPTRRPSDRGPGPRGPLRGAPPPVVYPEQAAPPRLYADRPAPGRSSPQLFERLRSPLSGQHRARRILVWSLLVALLFDAGAQGYFLMLNAVDPPFTTFMLAGGSFTNDHVDLEYINLYMLNATLAHEDAELPDRFTGLDWAGFVARGVAFAGGKKDPAGSPIPEQLSKNLLLWSSQDPFRKTVDAVLAEQLVHSVSKQRVLELYLNVAQFGPHLYGVCDASWYYFGHAPDTLTKDESAQLMGVLPGPIHTHRAAGGGIDMNPDDADGWYELKKIRGSRAAVAYEIAANGGDLALVRRLGLTRAASEQPDGSGSCRSMPSDVADMIAHGE